MIGLPDALVAVTAVVHVLAARMTRQPPAVGPLASAQLGVPAAIVALGPPEHVITSTQGAATLTPRAQKPSRPPLIVEQRRRHRRIRPPPLGLRSFPMHGFGPARLAAESSQRRLHV